MPINPIPFHFTSGLTGGVTAAVALPAIPGVSWVITSVRARAYQTGAVPVTVQLLITGSVQGNLVDLLQVITTIIPTTDDVADESVDGQIVGLPGESFNITYSTSNANSGQYISVEGFIK